MNLAGQRLIPTKDLSTCYNKNAQVAGQHMQLVTSKCPFIPIFKVINLVETWGYAQAIFLKYEGRYVCDWNVYTLSRQ